jgi:SAM-dependent methyltransferase
MTSTSLKAQVAKFWNARSCGEVYAEGESLKEQLDAQARERCRLEPYIFDFAKFHEGRNKNILEVGVGMGADHLEWSKAQPRSLTGIDITPRALAFTKQRLQLHDRYSKLMIADAECLPFEDNSFDLIYSWGVLHHTPNTQEAFNEVWRALRPNGTARIMIYHRRSVVASMLWLRYGALKGNFNLTLDEVFARYMESPGTKAYSVDEAKQLCSRFTYVSARSMLSFGDLLQGEVGQRHRGMLLSIAKRLWPRWLIRAAFRNCGTMLLIEARK